MKNNILATAAILSDRDLLARVEVLALQEREAAAELVAHLAELDTRPVLYVAGGYGSLFGYCRQALGLSEDAACTRIDVARTCRRFPQVLDLLVSGALSLTTVRLLAPHLTAENHQAVLARATHKSRREVKALIAELAPQADARSLIRKLPSPAAAANMEVSPSLPLDAAPIAAAVPELPSAPVISSKTAAPMRPAPRPVLEPTAPARYRVQFTIGAETEDKLRRLQTLLRREIPSGDPGVIFDRAISLLLEKVERAKLGKAARPRPQPLIRPETDADAAEGMLPPREPSNAVKRAVWTRDGGQCAFVSPGGRRCSEQAFLEFHHRRPHALRGDRTIENIALRCRRHNQYEAELVFGPGGPSPPVAPTQS